MNKTVIVANRELNVGGRVLRKITLRDEAWVETPLLDPRDYVQEILRQRLNADLFSFFLPLPETQPRFPFHIEWENIAAVPITTYAEWWDSLPQESRKNIRRAEKRGLSLRTVDFDDLLVRGISGIYDETPIRQGRRFWHYRKPLTQVKAENGTYLEKSHFIGAFLGEELVGFLKFVMVNKIARIMQILSKEAHFDKRPMNALLAKAIETAAGLGASHFVYGEYVYGTKENSPMTEFKRRNGFVRLDYPRYFVPLSLRGRIALGVGLHRSLLHLVPEPVISIYLKTRAELYRRTLRGAAAHPVKDKAGTESPIAA